MGKRFAGRDGFEAERNGGMGIETTTVYLTDQELALLDGHCNEGVQTEVDKAKARLKTAELLGNVPDNLIPFVSRIIEEARATGRLILSRRSLHYCNVCGKSAGYAKYKRTGRYHRKGEPNYDKPLSLWGVELADRFVRIGGRATLGCCGSCWNKVKPFLADALRDIRAEIPEAITGYPPRWVRYDNRKCSKCGWEGHEGEMGRLPVMMGRGTYPGECPQCHAQNLPMGHTIIKVQDGFQVVERKEQ